MRKLLTPICWFIELWYAVRYNENISGHSYKEQDDNSLKCKVCGAVSK